MKGLKHPLVLLLAVSSLASCRLVANFMDPHTGCPQFFLNGQFPPTILQDHNNVNRYQQICQRHMGADRFATFYDTVYKIPVYSGYLHVPHMQLPRINIWWTEPELDIDHQASNRDYTGSGYDKGHLYPAYSNNNPVGVDATFTLTNAAPQDPDFNKQWYHAVEKPLNQLMQKNCGRNRGYIVTGVVPDPDLTINNRVTVADYFWTAYCCLDNNNNVIARGAYLMNQNGDVLITDEHVERLEDFLNNMYFKVPFQVFRGRC